MRAFKSVRSEMRENAVSATHPYEGKGKRSTEQKRDTGADDDLGHVEPWMATAFHGLLHARETGEPYGLISCFMNGQPAAVIGLAREVMGRTHVLPLFLAVTAGMKFSEHPPEPDGEGKPR